jgi:hypothetical protein
MNNMSTFLALTITSCSLLLLSPANADEATNAKEQPIAHALSKKINKDIEICMENGSTQSREFENHKHLKMMMPETYEKCEKGITSACDVKKSMLIAMELANNKG